MILDGDENKNYLEASVVSVLEESGQATGDKLHAEAEGDDVLVGRDGQKPKPYRPTNLSCIVVVGMFEYLVLSVRPWRCPRTQRAGNWPTPPGNPEEGSGEYGRNRRRGKNERRGKVHNTSKPPAAIIIVGMFLE